MADLYHRFGFGFIVFLGVSWAFTNVVVCILLIVFCSIIVPETLFQGQGYHVHRVMRRRDHRPRPRNYTLPRCTESTVLRTWHITGELHTATVGTHAGSLRHTFRWDWDGMGHGSRALWVGSTHCTEYGVLSRTLLIIQDHCTEYHLRASHPLQV